MKCTFKISYITGWNGGTPKKHKEQVTVEAKNFFKAKDRVIRMYNSSEFGSVNLTLIKATRNCKSCKVIKREIHTNRATGKQIKELCRNCKASTIAIT